MSIRGLAFVALIAVFGLAACLGGGGGGGEPAGLAGAAADPDAPEFVTPIVAPGYPTPPAIPVAPFAAAIAAIPGVSGSIRVTTDTTGMRVGDTVEILQTGAHGAYVKPYDGGVTPGNYEGIFTVTAVSLPLGPGGTFDVAITFTTPEGASTQIIAGGTPPACATTGDLGDFKPVDISASRYSGVAPLAVFFEPNFGAGAFTATARPFHELDYTWDFDDGNLDPAIGNWGATVDGTGDSGSGANISRKTDSGPLAAHVYEKAGTYRVRLTVKDVNGKSVTNNCVEIAVQDPNQVFANNTACFSNIGSGFAGCPLIPGTYANDALCLASGKCITTSNFVTAVANYTTYKRLLFKRGDTFTVGGEVRIQSAAAGPGLIGAFGAGAAPAPKVRLLSNTYNGSVFRLGGPTFSDWRIVDLEIDLNNASNPTAGTISNVSRALQAIGNMTDLLMQRLWVHDGANGYSFSDPTAAPPWDKIFLVDSTFQNLGSDATHGTACFMSGQRVAYMGNRVNTTNSHNTRFPCLIKAVISHNHHNTPGSTTSNMKIHAPDFPTYGGSTQNVVLSSNKLVSGSTDWMIELQPQSRNNNERLQNIIVERNLFESAPGLNGDVMSVSGANITVRNNIVNLSASPNGLAFTVGRFGNCAPTCEPEPENIDIFHNTIYTNQGPTGSTLKFITLRSTISSAFPVRAKNNLGYAPFQTVQPPQLIDDQATGTVKAGNSANSDVLTTDPLFAGNFSLTGAYPVGGDATVPVMTDFFGAARIKPGAGTVGADEFP